MPPPASSSSSSKLSIKTLFWSLLLATTTALLGLVYDEPKKDTTEKNKENDKVEGSSSNSSPDVTIKGVEEKEYEDCGAKAVDAFKAGDFMEALNGFTHALALGKDLGGVSAQQKTILSNRSACYEKLGQYSAALDDCASILRTDPKNSKVQKRRERILGKLLEGEEFQAALTELMVTFLLDMEAYKRQGGKTQGPRVLPSTYTIKQVLNLLPSYQTLRGTINTLRQIEQITADLDALSSSSSSSPSSRLLLLFERALAFMAADSFKRGDQDLTEALRLVREE
ncbi:mitochondrial precursor protein import receptor, partial [Nannochloropsis oceanica]